MSSFVTSGVRSGQRHRLKDPSRARHWQFSCCHPSLARLSGVVSVIPLAGDLVGVARRFPVDARAEEFAIPASMTEAPTYPLDAAEQRNAEDSPSGIARQSSFGLTG